MRRFRWLLVPLLAVLLAATVFAAPAFAVHAASCGWRTDGTQFYSPTYNEYPFYVGHVVIGGKYYRDFEDWNYWIWGGYYLHDSVVYCG